MAITIDSAFISTYEGNVRYLAQQTHSKLLPYVQSVTKPGEDHNWDRLGATAAVLKTGPREATPLNDSDWTRRVSQNATYHVSDTVEMEDPTQMLIDPTSAIIQNQSMAMGRQFDDIILAAATGTALDGAGVNNPLPPAQTIGTGAAPISFDYVTQVQEQFMNNDIDPSVGKVFVVGPTQVRKLMQLTEQTSSDYVKREALAQLNATGIVPNWMGFTWIMSTRLLEPAGGEKSCIAMTDKALGLQINRNISANMAQDPTLSFAWRLYCSLTAGAVRVEDEQIVELHVADTV